MRNIILASAIIATIAALAACGRTERPSESGAAPAEADGPLSVFVVNYPLSYFAERIGGDKVNLSFPAPADDDPATGRPTPQRSPPTRKPT